MISMANDPTASEFGGSSGLIQPPPHELTAIEEARIARAVDPGSLDDSEEAARLRGGAQKGGRSSQRTGPAVPGGSGTVE